MIEDFKPCDKCNNGYIYYMEDENTECVKKCKCYEKYLIEKKKDFAFSKSNLPEYIKNYDIQTYLGKDKQKNLIRIKDFIENFKNNSSEHLFFHGAYGTQKSTLSRYIGYNLLKQGFTVYYGLMADISRLLTEADMDSEKKEYVDFVLNVDHLILDEFSKDKVTIYKSEYQIPFITSFLKKRFEINRKSTIIISNQDITEFKKFSGTIGDLISREVGSENVLTFEDVYEYLKEGLKIKEKMGS